MSARDTSRDIHTVPLGDLVDHETTGGARCWCCPRVEAKCAECDGAGFVGSYVERSGEPSGPQSACWRCEGVGFVPCKNPEQYDGAAPLHVIHNAADGRE